jgi:hypothetical protein
MFRRMLPFAPLMPALPVIAFAAAGAAAQGLADMSAANAVSDVQIGERGRLMRVAVICVEECRIGAKSSGVFFLPGVKDELEIDLAGRAKNAQRLSVKAEPGGAALIVGSDQPIVAASIKRCAIDGAAASCIDIEFEDPAMASARTELLVPSEASHQERGQAAGPELREAPEAARLVFASLAPPERLDAPRPQQKPPPPTAAAKPEGPRLILDEAKAEALIGARVDIGGEARRILGRSFSSEDCAAAAARLKDDAWALDAMVDIGFCEAIRGDLAAAEGVFERLLAYTPDNYEALVGRALIAARQGSRSRAEELFQEALNALPPIAESDRIVAAMGRL